MCVCVFFVTAHNEPITCFFVGDIYPKLVSDPSSPLAASAIVQAMKKVKEAENMENMKNKAVLR